MILPETAAEEVDDDIADSATNRRGKKPLKLNLSAQPCQKKQYLSLTEVEDVARSKCAY